MEKTVNAIYENGVLRLLDPLPLRDHQQVRVTVKADTPQSADPERVRQMHAQADAWLAQQPPSAVREPIRLSIEEKERLDKEFDELLAEIHLHTSDLTEDEVAELVDEAVNAIREQDA